MKTLFSSNGQTRLVLSPENELERVLLQELFKGPIEAQQHQTLQCLDTTYPDAVVITPIKG